MSQFLQRLKLIDQMTTTLRISKEEFIHRLKQITDIGSFGLFSDTMDVFSSNKNEFKGQVFAEGFKIKRRKKFFDTNMNLAVATGTFSEDNEHLVIDTQINGLSTFILVFYVFLIIIYTFVIVISLLGDHKVSFFIIPTLLLHGIFMFSIPYFVMRNSVKRLKYELDREFYYLTKAI